MKKNNHRLSFILGLVGIGLSLLMYIPFGKTFGNAEVIVKLIALPAVVAILNIIITAHKFNEYRPNNRFLSVIGYAPVVAYLVSLSVYVVFLLNRTAPMSVLTFNRFVYTVILCALVAVGLVMLLLCAMDKVNLALSKNEVSVLDIAIYVIFALDIFAMKSLVLDKFQDVALTNSSAVNVAFCIILGVGILGVIAYRVTTLYLTQEVFENRSKQEMLDKWAQAREKAYYNAELYILYSMNQYTNERLVYEDEIDENAEVSIAPGQVVVESDQLATLKQELKSSKANQKLAVAQYNQMAVAYAELQNKVKLDVANAELETLKKELELVNESLNKEKEALNAESEVLNAAEAELKEKVAKLQAENEPEVVEEVAVEKETPAEEVAEVKAEEKPAEAAPKKEKVFVPSYEEMVEFAQKLNHEDLSVVVNPAGNQHKFMVGAKPYLLMQKTSSDYRVTFFVEEAALLDYLQGYPGQIEVAKTPKVGNWLKIVNTGELEPEFLKKLVSESLDAELAWEKAIQEAKEAEAQAKAEAKELERQNREKLKEAEKIIAKAQKDAEKAEKEAERRAKQEAAAQAKAEKETAKAIKEAAEAARKEAEEKAAQELAAVEAARKEAEEKAAQELAAAEAARKEAEEKAAQEAEAAEAARKQAELDAEAAEKARQEAEAAEKARIEAEKEAEELEKQAAKALKEAEKKVAKAEKEVEKAEKEAEKKVAKAEKEAEKAGKEAEKKVAKAAKEIEAAKKEAAKKELTPEEEAAKKEAAKAKRAATMKAKKEAEEKAKAEAKAAEEKAEKAQKALEKAKAKAESEAAEAQAAQEQAAKEQADAEKAAKALKRAEARAKKAEEEAKAAQEALNNKDNKAA